jgi:DNA helicase-2/ATP-dependent DNA helicase PcrA
VLCLGGPGSGKTTISLLKAENEISKGVLNPGQRVLFLSFARATISRVEEHAAALLKCESRSELEISTYHGFTWAILKSHGYLLTSEAPIKLLPPSDSAALLSSIEGDSEKAQEKRRLFEEEGRLDFDLFASCAAELLNRSSKVRSLISPKYPLIILDEFQDTDSNEWELIKALGQDSRLIALADPEQRIYEFRGASPTRIPEFIAQFDPAEFDFSTTNHRSNGTDICTYGNDLLKGANKGKSYSEVSVKKYPPRKAPAVHLCLKIEVWQRRKAIIDAGVSNWSIGVLVPTKQMMLDVSDYLASTQILKDKKKVPSIDNEAALDAAGPALAAEAIAGVLAGSSTPVEIAQRLVNNLSSHMRGRKGGAKPSQTQLALADSLDSYLTTGTIRGSRRKALADECLEIANGRINLELCGDPGADWLLVHKLLAKAKAPELRAIAEDARFLKFLNRGTQLRSRLAEIWRMQGSYVGADAAVSGALVQEHFAASKRVYRGIHVMTIHKSKGKQFTEVIIYEGAFQGRILRQNADERAEAQARLSLRVGVTRAERFSTILTPARNPCPFL